MSYRGATLATLLLLSACMATRSPRIAADALPRCALPQPVASRTYLVFFDRHGTALNARARVILGEFVRYLSDFDRLHVIVQAGTDTSENTWQDRDLAWRRGQAVVAALRDSGMAGDTEFMVEKSGLLVLTPRNVPEAQNRYVNLTTRGQGRRLRPTAAQTECRAWLDTHSCGHGIGSDQAIVCARARIVADEFQPPGAE